MTWNSMWSPAIRIIMRGVAASILAATLLIPTTSKALSWEAIWSWLADSVQPSPEPTGGGENLEFESGWDWGIVPEPFLLSFAGVDLRSKSAILGLRFPKSGLRVSVSVDLDCLRSAIAKPSAAIASGLAEVRQVRFRVVGDTIEATFGFTVPPSTKLIVASVLFKLDSPCVKILGTSTDGDMLLSGGSAPGGSGEGQALPSIAPTPTCADAVLELGEPLPPIGTWLPGSLALGTFIRDQTLGAALPPAANCSPMCPLLGSAEPSETFWCEQP